MILRRLILASPFGAPFLTALVLAVGALTATPAEAASSGERPNLLFVIFDDWGAGGNAHSSIGGNTWIMTPSFDRIAREGVLFTNAFTSNPKCSPCRASILIGRNSWQLREAVSHNGYFPAGFETYPDLLERAGYTVGLTGKGWAPGDFKTRAGRTRNPAGPSFDRNTLTPPTSQISRNDYSANFAAFLDQRPRGKPFCFWMGFLEPHRNYEAGSGLRLGKKLEDVTVPPYLPDTPTVRSDLLDYAVEVEYADSHIGRALDALEAAGELDNTLIVVTSDHGMPFPFVKGQIHEDGFHVPMAMRWGRAVPPGRVVEDFVNVRDLAPTFMELAGLQPHPQMTGRSLMSILRSPASGWIEHRNEMLIGKERHDIGRPNDMGYPVRALRTPEFLYVRNHFPDRWPAGNPETDFGNVDGSPTKELLKRLGGHYYDLSFGKRPPEELFQLATDPAGIHNLAHDPYYTTQLETMRSRMLHLLREEEDPRALGHSQIFDSYPYVAGRAKGYETWLAKQDGPTSAPVPPPASAKASASGARSTN